MYFSSSSPGVCETSQLKAEEQQTVNQTGGRGHVCLKTLTHFREIIAATYSQSLETTSGGSQVKQTHSVILTYFPFICYTIYLDTFFFHPLFCYCIVSSLLCIFIYRVIHTLRNSNIFPMFYFCYRFMVNNIICK